MNELQNHDASLLEGCSSLIGIDEAGRGALAGPVVAGACLLNGRFFRSKQWVEASSGINDSKQLNPGAREAFFETICTLQSAGALHYAVARGSIQEIEQFNILGATRLAMQRAVEKLADRAEGWSLPSVHEDPLFSEETASFGAPNSGAKGPPSCPVKLIVDGRPLKPFPYRHEGIIKGDGKSLAIAVASIVAKVTRDRELVELAAEYPQYGFSVHKGYATRAHREAILAHGPCPVHRPLFLRKILASGGGS